MSEAPVPDDLEEDDVPDLSPLPDNEPEEGAAEPPGVEDPLADEAPEQNKHEE